MNQDGAGSTPVVQPTPLFNRKDSSMTFDCNWMTFDEFIAEDRLLLEMPHIMLRG